MTITLSEQFANIVWGIPFLFSEPCVHMAMNSLLVFLLQVINQ